jgi:DNA-directed RNA polymerase specialized sigma24 family protein
MGVVIIPFDYEQLPESQQKSIVPICIASVDRHGNQIARVWFEEGVAPVQDQLRNIARYKLGDVRLVSELAEITVHKLWERHGEDAGIWPWRRVLVRATWEARDMAAGDSQWLIRHTVPLALGLLEHDLYGNGLPDPTNYDEVYERELLVELVERRIESDHRDEIRRVFKMWRQGYTWEEIAAELHDPKPGAVKKRFWRWIRQNFPQKPPQKPLHPGRHMP